MIIDDLDNLFKEKQDCWDIAEPANDHQARFLHKLNSAKAKKTKVRSLDWWKPLLVAASIVAIISIVMLTPNQSSGKELAAVSPEMQQTQDFFTQAIEKELYSLRQEQSPLTEALIKDALKQLNVLEKDYDKLKEDLADSGEDRRVIHAMISNFQARIDLLNQVLDEIEELKTLNTTNHEDNLL